MPFFGKKKVADEQPILQYNSAKFFELMHDIVSA